MLFTDKFLVISLEIRLKNGYFCWKKPVNSTNTWQKLNKEYLKKLYLKN